MESRNYVIYTRTFRWHHESQSLLSEKEQRDSCYVQETSVTHQLFLSQLFQLKMLSQDFNSVLKEMDITESVTVPDLSALCHALSSSLLRKMPLLLLFKLHVAKLPGARRVIQLMPKEKVPKNACTLETMLSGCSHPQAKTFQELVSISSNDKIAWVYKLTQQIINALRELYRALEQLQKTNQRVVCIHGLLKPCSIYRYPNGTIRLTYYGIANTLQPYGIYYDLCCLSSIFSILCSKLLLPAEVSESFDAAVRGLEEFDKTEQLNLVVQFIDNKLESLSDSKCLTGHLTIQPDICTDLKDGAIDPAVSDTFVVDELESSSMRGVSASSQPRRFHCASDTGTSLVDSRVKTVQEENALIPKEVMKEIREQYHYLFEGSFSDAFCPEESQTMTILFDTSNARQCTCPYLTYMSILSSKHPMQKIKHHLVNGEVLHALLRDEFFDVLLDQSLLTTIVTKLLTDFKVILQILEIAFCGTSNNEEYLMLTSSERIQLHDSMPRLLRAFLQISGIANVMLITNAEANLDESKILALWAILKKGINNYCNWVHRNTCVNSDGHLDGWTVELANSCSACLRVYMHVAIIFKQSSFTQQIDQNENFMNVVLEFTKLSLFESTFHLYFRGRLCSHILPNRMVLKLMEKNADGTFSCSITETICVCELLIVYLIHNGISGFMINSIGMLISFLISIFQMSVTNPLLEEYHKIPIITKVVVNYFVIHLSQVSIRLLKDTDDAQNAKRNIAVSFELLKKLCHKIGDAVTDLMPIESLRDNESITQRISLIYFMVDCLSRIFHCVGGVEHLIVRTLESVHIGDEYAQICKNVCMREDPLFIDYSNLPSTAMQGLGGPTIWRGDEYQQNRQKLLPVYLGMISLFTENLATFFRELLRVSAIENASLIHVRLTMIRNMLVEAIHIIFQYDASKLNKACVEAFNSMRFGEYVEHIIQKYYKEEELQNATIQYYNNSKINIVAHCAFCTIRKIIELNLDLDEVHVFYARHLMCSNSIDRNDLPASPDRLIPLTRNVFLEGLKALSTNQKFISFLHMFNLSYELIYMSATCDSFYREIPVIMKNSIVKEASSNAE